MATLSVGHLIHRKYSPIQERRKSNCTSSLSLTLLSCQSNKPMETSNPKPKKDQKEEGKPLLPRSFGGFEKIGKVLKENLSPKQKGDWKDLVLMSLSFAVYVYISQKIVCAYTAWMSMPKQPW